MSLKATYERFLASPTPEALSANVALNYITTTTTFNNAEPVARHLNNQTKVVKKESEKILGTVEGPHSICLDTEITLEFLTGGGAYLPGLDDNFLINHVVTFPMVSLFLYFMPSFSLCRVFLFPICPSNTTMNFFLHVLRRSILSISITRGKFHKSDYTGIKARFLSRSKLSDRALAIGQSAMVSSRPV